MDGVNNSHFKILPTEKDPIVQYQLAERVIDKDYIRRHEQMKVLFVPGYINRWETTKY